MYELLELMLAHYSSCRPYLCFAAWDLCEKHIINSEEFNLLWGYIQENRPSKYSSLAAYRSYKTPSGIFWKTASIEKGRKHRIKWLKKHIEKTKASRIVYLLEVLKENENAFTTGLCSWIFQLHYTKVISSADLELLMTYVINNGPISTHRLLCFVGLRQESRNFYWKRGDIEPRLKWIDKHIKKNSSAQPTNNVQ